MHAPKKIFQESPTNILESETLFPEKEAYPHHQGFRRIKALSAVIAARINATLSALSPSQVEDLAKEDPEEVAAHFQKTFLPPEVKEHLSPFHREAFSSSFFALAEHIQVIDEFTKACSLHGAQSTLPTLLQIPKVSPCTTASFSTHSLILHIQATEEDFISYLKEKNIPFYQIKTIVGTYEFVPIFPEREGIEAIILPDKHPGVIRHEIQHAINHFSLRISRLTAEGLFPKTFQKKTPTNPFPEAIDEIIAYLKQGIAPEKIKELPAKGSQEEVVFELQLLFIYAEAKANYFNSHSQWNAYKKFVERNIAIGSKVYDCYESHFQCGAEVLALTAPHHWGKLLPQEKISP